MKAPAHCVHPPRDIRFGDMNRVLLLVVGMTFSLAASLFANDNVRDVQTRLKGDGFDFGEVDGAFSSELSAAITRYQIRHGLQVSGQLDEETSKALGAQPAVTTATPEAAPNSEAWRRLRKSDQEYLMRLNARYPQASQTTHTRETTTSTTRSPAAPTPATTAPTDDASAPATDAEPADAQPSYASQNRGPAIVPPSPQESAAVMQSTERLRDYVGAFVLAGLDPRVGAELEFFADRVRYYDEGTVDRDQIRRSLQSYNELWPQRRFWIAGDIAAKPETDGRLRVTFPLRFELANGSKRSSGKVQKTIVLEATGDDLQIVAVNETKAR